MTEIEEGIQRATDGLIEEADRMLGDIEVYALNAPLNYEALGKLLGLNRRMFDVAERVRESLRSQSKKLDAL